MLDGPWQVDGMAYDFVGCPVKVKGHPVIT